MSAPNSPPRPRLTVRILTYALADIFGLACIAIGGAWFIDKQRLFIDGFPHSLAEAVACTVGGATIIGWAVARILREIGKQGPQQLERYADSVAPRPPTE